MSKKRSGIFPDRIFSSTSAILMDYFITKPSNFLSQYVKHYWSLQHCNSIKSEHIQRIVPSGLFELIFYFKDKPESLDDKKQVSDPILITGQLKNFYDLKISGDLELFSIDFHPHGLSMFLDLPMKEIFNHSIPLRFVLHDTVNQLEDELSSADSHEERVKITENFLISRLRKNEKKYHYDKIRNLINLINKEKGLVDINTLVADTFLSRKQFERVFAEIIGTSPKQFLKVVRFQNAIYEKTQNPDLNLTELAYKCGYFDQAHMINDFKTLSGYTPLQYFKDCEPFSDYFN